LSLIGGDVINKKEKCDWIVNYITLYGWQDTFMEDFVNSYVDECKPNKYEETLWGSYKVSELGRYLFDLYKRGVLDRFTVGLNYQCDGFPKWCYGYCIKQ
jgi:hypothetical protein